MTSVVTCMYIVHRVNVHYFLPAMKPANKSSVTMLKIHYGSFWCAYWVWDPKIRYSDRSQIRTFLVCQLGCRYNQSSLYLTYEERIIHQRCCSSGYSMYAHVVQVRLVPGLEWKKQCSEQITQGRNNFMWLSWHFIFLLMQVWAQCKRSCA